jgi:hypothetical protein
VNLAPNTLSVVFGPGRESAAREIAMIFETVGVPSRSVPAQASRITGAELGILLLIAVPAQSFFAALVKALGDASGQALAGFFGQVYSSVRGGPRQTVPLRDAVHDLEIELSEDLPWEAYEQLVQVVSSESAIVTFDIDRGVWVLRDRA